MFRRDARDLVKGSILTLTIDALLDFSGERGGHFRMIECELQSHNAYGTPRDLFGKFFDVIAETMREVLGEAWSSDIADAWRRLLTELDELMIQYFA